MGNYFLLLPELILLAVVFWALFAKRLPGGDRGAAFLGFAVATASAVMIFQQPVGGSLFNGLMLFDASARFVQLSVAVMTAIWMLWVVGKKGTRTREAVSVAALVAVGAMLLAASQELITMFVCLELMTIPGYILIGYRRNDRRSLEGALKYFLLSMTTSLVMLYGFSILYGVSGTTRFTGLTATGGILPTIAGLLVLAGIFAKLSAAPFHFWAPDAYEGSDSWLVSFVSTVPKISSFLILMRLGLILLPSSTELVWFMIAVSILGMVLGNLSALGQHDIRRMMAYSGVAQIGYAIIGIVAFASISFNAALYFVVCYAFAAMGVLLAVSAQDSSKPSTLKNLAGFSKQHPGMAAAAVILLLSLIGIPPLAGFMGKFFLFAGVLGIGNTYLYLIVIAIVASIVSAAYYLRPVKAMFFDTPVEEEIVAQEVLEEVAVENGQAAVEAVVEVDVELPAKAPNKRGNVYYGLAIGLCVVGTVALGVFASPIFTYLLQLAQGQ